MSEVRARSIFAGADFPGLHRRAGQGVQMSSGYTARIEHARRIEERSRREQRAELAALRREVAELTERARALHDVAPALEVPVVVGEPAEGTSAAALQSYVATVRTRLSDAQREVRVQAEQAWAGRLRLSMRVDGEGSARVRLARQRARADAATRFRAERAAAETAAARAAFAANAGRCAPEDLAELGRLAQELPEGDTVAAASLSRRVALSIERRTGESKAEARRARLLVLVEQAPGGERATLRALVRNGRDLDAMAAQVEAAVEREDQARDRAATATAVTEALTDIGCEVGADFDTYLADAQAAIVGLRGFDGYGVRVTLTAGRLESRVVRHAQTSHVHDIEAEETVCGGLDRALARMTASGVTLRTLHRVEPGGLVPAVAAERWKAEYRPVEGSDWQGDDEPVLREMRHDD